MRRARTTPSLCPAWSRLPNSVQARPSGLPASAGARNWYPSSSISRRNRSVVRSLPAVGHRGAELLARREAGDPVGDGRDGGLGGGGDRRQGDGVVVEVDLQPLGLQQPLERLAHVQPQAVGEEDAGPHRRPRRAGRPRVRGGACPGAAAGTTRRRPGARGRRRGRRRRRPPPGPPGPRPIPGPPAPPGRPASRRRRRSVIRSSRPAPWRGCSGRLGEPGEVGEGLGQRRLAQGGPGPVPALPVGLLQHLEPLAGRRDRLGGQGVEGLAEVGLGGVVVLGPGLHGQRGEEVAGPGLGLGPAERPRPGRHSGRGRRRTASRRSSRPGPRGGRASRPRPVRRPGSGRSRSRPGTGRTGSRSGRAPSTPGRPWGRPARSAGRPPGHRRSGGRSPGCPGGRSPTWRPGRRPARRRASPRSGGSTGPWRRPGPGAGRGRPGRTGGRRRGSSPCRWPGRRRRPGTATRPGAGVPAGSPRWPGGWAG